MGLVLFITAFLLSLVLFPLGLIYSLIRLPINRKIGSAISHLNKLFYRAALSIDQLGNVWMQHLFNDIMIKPEGHKFGDEDETISSVLGRNKLAGTLRVSGKALDAILDFLDPNHSIKSIGS